MTREVANWFHDRVGELFTQDEIPFSRQEVVQVIDDSVDPIQQVIVDAEKYIGIISYTEHEGWYEYTRWSDAHGEVNMGVCAQCVKEAEAVSEVSRTVGDDTETTQEKFESHYRQEHDVVPEEVETGAVLLGGTTINGNTAIHPGMDGAGSGVDADFVKGREALKTGVFYTFEEIREFIAQFGTPGIDPRGVDLDSSDCVWHIDGINDSIYRSNQSGDILTQFQSPSGFPRDLGVESNGCIWSPDDGVDDIFQQDQVGAVINQIPAPDIGPEGLGFDTSDCIWNSNRITGAQSIYKLDQTGTILTQFVPPSSVPQGIGVDSANSIWHADADAVSIYKLDQTGTVLTQFSAASDPRGVGVDTEDSVWYSDGGDSNSIYKLNVNFQF